MMTSKIRLIIFLILFMVMPNFLGLVVELNIFSVYVYQIIISLIIILLFYKIGIRLVHNENDLRFLNKGIDSLSMVYIIFDSKWNIKYKNKFSDLVFKNQKLSNFEDLKAIFLKHDKFKQYLEGLQNEIHTKKSCSFEFKFSEDVLTWKVILSRLGKNSTYKVLSIIDITPYRNMESEKNNPNIWEYVVTKAPIGYMKLNQQNNIMIANDMICKWLDYQYSDLIIGKNIKEFIKNTDKLRKNTEETELIKKNGQKMAVKTYMVEIPRSSFKSIYFYESYKDIKKDALSDLESIKRIFHSTPIGIIVIDKNCMLMECNNYFPKIINEKVSSNVDCSKFFVDDLKKILANKIKDKNFDIPVITKLINDVKVIIHIKGLTENKFIIYIIHSYYQKQLDNQTEQSQKMQALGRIAGGIAHDFNNLLTAMTGHCDLLLNRYATNSAEFVELAHIKQNCHRATSLVKQLLVFARKQKLKPEIIDLKDVFEDFSPILKRLIGPNIEIQVDYESDLKNIKMDKVQIEQVILNLALNAKDALEEANKKNSYIKICGTNEILKNPFKDKHIIIPKGEYVTISIKDNGMGIKEDLIGQIFEPFFTTKEVGEGTGLGLSIVHGIITQAGSYIAINSKQGKGTEFKLYIPAYNAENKGKSEDTDKFIDLSGEGKILVVEDEESVRAFTCRALSLKGYEVMEASSADEGLAYIEKEDKIDLMISDVVMPKVDGIDLLEKARKSNKNLKVLFISGYTQENFTKVLKEKNVYFLPKPYSMNDIAQKVKDIIELPESADDSHLKGASVFE